MKDWRRRLLMNTGDVLPRGYKLCEYILVGYDNKYEYIDTGVKGLNSDIEMRFSPQSDTTDCLWCARNGTGKESNTLFLMKSFSGINDKKIRLDYGGMGSYPSDVTLYGGTTYTLKKTGQKLYLNEGRLIYTSPHTLETCPWNIYLFDSYTTPYIVSGSDKAFTGKCYYCKMWNNDVLVRDFIPVYKVDTSEYGLWDKVNHRFYKSGNSNKFGGKIQQ